MSDKPDHSQEDQSKAPQPHRAEPDIQDRSLGALVTGMPGTPKPARRD